MDSSIGKIGKDVQYFITSVTSALTAFCAWQTMKNQYFIFGERRKISRIENNEVLGVQELVGKARKVNEVVLVRGNIGTKDGKEVEIKQGYFSSQKFAVHLNYSEAMYSNDAFQKDNYQLNIKEVLKNCTIEGSTKVTLYEESGKEKKSILIKNFDQKNYSKVMEIIKWDEKRRSLDLVEHINAFFLSLLEALITIGSEGRQLPHIRGIEVGRRDIEVGVKIGATASILGTIGFTSEGEMFIEANQIFKDRLSELSALGTSLDEYIKKRNLWLAFTALGSIYLGRRAFKYCKEKGIKIPYLNP